MSSSKVNLYRGKNMKNIFKKKKTVIEYDTTNGSKIAWGEGRFVSHSKLLSDLKELLNEKYGEGNFHITDVIKL